MDIGLMVEGQNGLTWGRWSHILALAERLGFPSVFRSDHYFIGEQQNTVEAFLSFAVAAKETTRLRFGPLVTPVTFRSPVDVGRMAAQLAVLSGGRFHLGVGAGWNQAEHDAYGILFPPVKERLDRLEESIAVMQALWGPGPASYQGQYYTLREAECLPKPPGRLPLIVGGNGEKRTLRIVAKHAAEWNCVNQSVETYVQKVGVLEQHCAEVGRSPAALRRSMMLFGFVGPTDREVTALLRGFFNDPAATEGELAQRARDRGMFAGATQAVVDYLGELQRLGMQEVEFQHLRFDDDALPEYLAAEVAPRMR